MATMIDVRELPSRLAEALSRASAGDEVILTDGTEPRARLMPLLQSQQVPKKTAGLHPGAMQASADFDEPLPDEFWTGSSSSAAGG